MSIRKLALKYGEEHYPGHGFHWQTLWRHKKAVIDPIMELANRSAGEDERVQEERWEAYQFNSKMRWLWDEMTKNARKALAKDDLAQHMEAIHEGHAMSKTEYDIAERIEARKQGNVPMMGPLGGLGLPANVQIGLCVGIAKSPMLDAPQPVKQIEAQVIESEPESEPETTENR
jgi:hypothetical protein